MEIRKIENLVEFVDKNYDRMTNKYYQLLVNKCLNLYEFEKPDTKENTIDRLLELHAFTKKYNSITELPLFLDED